MANTTAVAILLEQLKEAHKWTDETMKGVTDKVAAYMPPGKANPIAGTYAHLIMSEDFFTHMLIQQKPPLCQTKFKDKTGADSLQPTEWETQYPKWLREVKVNMKQFQKYAKAVNKASEAYVASLTDKDLLKPVDMSMFGMDKRPLHAVLTGYIIGHANAIMGEIAVLKGIQDLKGYPF